MRKDFGEEKHARRPASWVAVFGMLASSGALGVIGMFWIWTLHIYADFRDVPSEMKEHASEIDELNQRLDSLPEKYEYDNRRISNLEATYATNQVRIDDRFNSVDWQLQTVNKRLDKLDSDVDQIFKRLGESPRDQGESFMLITNVPMRLVLFNTTNNVNADPP